MAEAALDRSGPLVPAGSAATTDAGEWVMAAHAGRTAPACRPGRRARAALLGGFRGRAQRARRRTVPRGPLTDATPPRCAAICAWLDAAAASARHLGRVRRPHGRGHAGPRPGPARRGRIHRADLRAAVHPRDDADRPHAAGRHGRRDVGHVRGGLARRRGRRRGPPEDARGHRRLRGGRLLVLHDRSRRARQPARRCRRAGRASGGVRRAAVGASKTTASRCGEARRPGLRLRGAPRADRRGRDRQGGREVRPRRRPRGGDVPPPVRRDGRQPFDLEVSVDETETPTRTLEHVYVASELAASASAGSAWRRASSGGSRRASTTSATSRPSRPTSACTRPSRACWGPTS